MGSPRALGMSVAVTLAVAACASGCGGANSSAAGTRPGNPDRHEFAKLERRPIRLPSLRGALPTRCPGVGAIGLPGIDLKGEGGLGPARGHKALKQGPIYSAFFSAAPRVVGFLDRIGSKTSTAEWGDVLGSSRWRPVPTLWVSKGDYDGPVLVRGERLDGPQRLGFGSRASPVFELRLPSGDWSSAYRNHGPGVSEEPNPPDGWRVAYSPTRVRSGGCYAFQVDGIGFRYKLSFSVQ